MGAFRSPPRNVVNRRSFLKAVLAALTAPPLATGLAGCAVAPAPSCAPPPSGKELIHVLGRGWHTQIGIPTALLDGKLGLFRSVFPGARTVMFGYGKRTFMVSPPNDISEYILGPFPRPAIIEAVGLLVSPPEAYGTKGMMALELPPGGAARLSAFIWNDLAHGTDGAPLLVAPGHFPGSLFYAARSEYGLFHTCNTWVAEALAAAGLPVDADALTFSSQTMARAAKVAAAQCQAAGGAGAGQLR